MRDLISTCAVGRVDGRVVLDLNKDEEDAEDAVDIPMAIMPSTEEIVLLQMDGLLSKDEWKKAFELGLKGCKIVHSLQVKALKEKYSSPKSFEKEVLGEKK
jgi:exosome complex component RRP41